MEFQLNHQPNRQSSLAAPVMALSGHNGAIHTLKFSPDGTVLASGSQDNFIFLWHVFSTQCENYMALKGHKNAILELHFTKDGERLISCSTDSTVRVWDTQMGETTKRMKCNALVNSCCPQPHKKDILASGSDDGCIIVWDFRVKGSVQTIQGQYPVTAVVFAHESNTIYSGEVDNCIRVYDRRNKQVLSTLEGHTDTITGMRLSPNGAYLLSNSMDNSLSVWNMRNQVNKNRHVKTFTGHIHTNEKDLTKCDWSPDGLRVAVGSGDHLVYIWDVASRQLIYKLPGHRGTVVEVAFHPTEPIFGSCSTDKNILLGEFTK